MIGMYCYIPGENGLTKIKYQGQILKAIQEGYYLVQLFAWRGGGHPTIARIFHVSDMKTWSFFEEWNNGDETYSESTEIEDLERWEKESDYNAV